MIQIKCPSCARWFEWGQKTGDMVCAHCGHSFTVGSPR